MSDQIVDPSAAPLPPPVIGGDELYDRIMAPIDPELVTASLPTLAATYAAETPEQAAARAERYRVAFEEYERQFKAYGAEWMSQFTQYQHQALASLEHADRTKEEQRLDDVLNQISSAA
jgi:hypothetical protein